MKREQIYQDLIEEMDEEHDKEHKSPEVFLKTENKYTKKLKKSIGWINFETDKYIIEGGNVELKKNRWTVNVDDESMVDCEKQETAEILSMVAQINERLIRIEKRLDEKK